MTGTIAITDYGWYQFLLNQPNVDEVNFWTPSAHWPLLADIGSPFFFKLRAKYNNAICGFAFFMRFDRLPDWYAWDSFGEKNGSPTLDAMRLTIQKKRKGINFRDLKYGDQIGCILLSQPMFFRENELIAGPRGWPPANLRNKKYDLNTGEGKRIWDECQERMFAQRVPGKLEQRTAVLEPSSRYGAPQLVQPRLGQGLFRVAVLDAYGRACAVTQEHSLPALEASHIKPYGQDGPHSVSNGILLRSDLHRLFDKGYLTITPEYHVEVSAKLRDEYHNGKTYYPLHGQKILLPESEQERPERDFLRWHNERIYRAA